MSDVKEVVNALEMSYKYSNVDEDNTLVPQRIVLNAIDLLKEQKAIVRCKDCKHGARIVQTGMLPFIICCGVDHDLDWFCADGERR